ncbi:MAG: hypothetical protein HY238_12590 [Acidobacteria bacterium]|nr:hypothetical protein [Acidobacteriota bacterium]
MRTARTDRTDPRQARKSALSVGLVLLSLGAFSYWRHHLLRAEILGSLGGFLLLLGLFAPRWAIPFHVAWMKFAAVLGYINSRIILSVMYYGVMTPIGVIMRLGGRDPLKRRHRASDSCWIPRAKTRQDRDQFERLF